MSIAEQQQRQSSFVIPGWVCAAAWFAAAVAINVDWRTIIRNRSSNKHGNAATNGGEATATATATMKTETNDNNSNNNKKEEQQNENSNAKNNSRKKVTARCRIARIFWSGCVSALELALFGTVESMLAFSAADVSLVFFHTWAAGSERFVFFSDLCWLLLLGERPVAGMVASHPTPTALFLQRRLQELHLLATNASAQEADTAAAAAAATTTIALAQPVLPGGPVRHNLVGVIAHQMLPIAVIGSLRMLEEMVERMEPSTTSIAGILRDVARTTVSVKFARSVVAPMMYGIAGISLRWWLYRQYGVSWLAGAAATVAMRMTGMVLEILPSLIDLL